jgi:hypothetical protein
MVPQDDGKHRDTQINGLQWYQGGDADVRPQSDRDFRRCLMDTRATRPLVQKTTRLSTGVFMRQSILIHDGDHLTEIQFHRRYISLVMCF